MTFITVNGSHAGSGSSQITSFFFTIHFIIIKLFFCKLNMHQNQEYLKNIYELTMHPQEHLIYEMAFL